MHGPAQIPLPSRQHPVRRAGTIAVLLVALSLIASLVPTSLDYLDPTRRIAIDLTEGSLPRQIQLLALFAIAAWLCYMNRYGVVAILRRINPFLVLITIYCLASVSWSALPIVTLKRVFILIGLVIVGLAIATATRRSHQLLINALLGSFTVVLVLSVGAVAVLPHIGIDHALGGAWRGITWHKNSLGSVAGYAVLLWMFEWTRNVLPRWACGMGLSFSLLVLFMSQSSTSILLAFMSCGIYLFWHRRWIQDTYINPMFLLVAAITGILFFHFYYVLAGRLPAWDSLSTPIATLFGKGPDLTGRTEIWHLLWLSIQQHPIAGIGYRAFWLGADSPSSVIVEVLGWMPSHGHNGYLDLLNELGVIGLTLFVGAILWHLAGCIRLMSLDRRMAALHLAILFMMLIRNITESDFLADTQLQNIIFIYLSFALSTQLALTQHRTSAEPFVSVTPASGPRTQTRAYVAEP